MPKVKKLVKKIKEKSPPIKRESKSGLTVPVYDLSGKETGSHAVSKEIFSIEVNKKLLAQYMRVYLANQRRGTASTKTRSQVQGSTRKIYRQKGTGRARHGDIKAPIFAGGGVVGGPKPRDFSLKMNKGHITRTILGTLTLKLKEKSIIALHDQFLTMQPKTKLMSAFLKALNFVKSRILIVLPKMEKNNLLYSARNLPNITLIDVLSLNPYEISKNSKLLIIESAFPLLEKHLLARGHSERAKRSEESSET